MKKYILTKKNFKDLKSKLENLIKIDKENIIIEIKKARERGDLSENSEYQAAKEKQKLIENKIFEIENTINNCEIIEKLETNKNKIAFSAKIKLKNLNNNEIINYKIVGNDEEDLQKGLISLESPIAKNLLGRSTNETITIKKFNKIIKFLILEIKYDE